MLKRCSDDPTKLETDPGAVEVTTSLSLLAQIWNLAQAQS